MQIEKTSLNIPVVDLYWQLQKHPEFWNENTARTSSENSPHYRLDDIWARYAEDLSQAQVPHKAKWYPVAETIPHIRKYAEFLQEVFQYEHLGGVLITRIPPGGECKGHIDYGWHAEHYDKFALQITSAPGQYFWVEDKKLITMPGDVYTFDNSKMHGVINHSCYERITMIICMSNVDPLNKQ